MPLKEALQLLGKGQNLSRERAGAALGVMMRGDASDEDIRDFLLKMREKGETAEELTGCVEVMRSLSERVHLNSERILDTCGTGGSQLNVFNTSTAAAFVAAAAGVMVAKHGNRAASGNSGSADVLEAAGVRIDLSPQEVAYCIEAIGIGFMFAQVHHSAMRHVIGVRRSMGGRTLFNLIGPLTNPAGANYQVVGVPSTDMVPLLAGVFQLLGCERVLVLASEDGLDEISPTAPCIAQLVEGAERSEYRLNPADLDVHHDLATIQVGGVEQSLDLVRQALQGEEGAALDTVALNAGAALWVAGEASDWKGGVDLARDILASGAGWNKLQQMVQMYPASASQ